MKLKYISWLPAVIIMGIIFMYSSKPAVNSDESSMFYANQILDVYEKITGNEIEGAEREKNLEDINHIVRKSAHFIEYGVLACFVAFHFFVSKRKRIHILLLATAISAIYAATDEFHQLFVSGRSGQMKDVLLDSSGAFTGALTFCLIITVLQRKKQTKIRQQ
ncbi:MAG: hypothetical protein K0S76_1346 [Herbinix sp.]|jgi:VanZ family protein|nr:hypothetical protein [Herbinix sp.]